MLWEEARIDLSKIKYFVFIGARLLHGIVASGASLANFAGRFSNLKLDHVLVFAPEACCAIGREYG